MIKRLWVLINCKINKILSLLAIMIFIFALSCANARVLTKEEIANYILNCYNDAYSLEPTQEMITNVNARMGMWQTIADLTSSYEGAYTLGYNYLNNRFFFSCYSGPETNMVTPIRWTTGTWNSQSSYFLYRYNTSKVSSKVYYYDLLTDNLNYGDNLDNQYSGQQICSFSSGNTRYSYLYTEKQIPRNDGISSTTFPRPIPAYTSYPTGLDLFSENYITSIQFDFEPTTQFRASISGDTSGYQYYVISKTFANTLFGTFADSSYLDNIYLNFRAYQSGEGWQDLLTNNYDCSNNKVSNYFYTYTQDDIQFTDIKIKSNSIPSNSVVTFIFSPNTTDFTEKAYSFYIANDKTIFNGGQIDIQATINNDSNYNNEINNTLDNIQNNDNSTNIQDIASAISDNSQVDSIVNEYFGTSGDLLNKLGYVSYGNPYVDTFYNILLTIKNVLLSNETITYDIYVANTYWGTLSSADFTTSGPLRVFVQALCIFLVVRFILKLFYSSFENIIEGDIKPIVNFFKGKAALITKFF